MFLLVSLSASPLQNAFCSHLYEEQDLMVSSNFLRVCLPGPVTLLLLELVVATAELRGELFGIQAVHCVVTI